MPWDHQNHPNCELHFHDFGLRFVRRTVSRHNRARKIQLDTPDFIFNMGEKNCSSIRSSRLQKKLTRAGVSFRRDASAAICQGRMAIIAVVGSEPRVRRETMQSKSAVDAALALTKMSISRGSPRSSASWRLESEMSRSNISAEIFHK